MKKIVFIVILSISLLFAFLTLRSFNLTTNLNETTSLEKPLIDSETELLVNITLEFSPSDKLSKGYPYKENLTALELLERIAWENSLVLAKKEYDWGTLIEEIGDKKNGRDFAWIFFVNGNAADRAADKVILAPSDLVEFKYIKPIYD